MKKVLVLSVLLALMTTAVSVDTQFRLAGNITGDFAHKPSLEDVQSVFDDGSSVFYGFHWEVILRRIGFGMHYLTRFDREATGFEHPRYDWTMDWNGDLFLSYHLFGGGAMLDPFFEIGYGFAGRIDTDDSVGTWEREDDRWHYVHAGWDKVDEGTVSNMSFYPYLGGGLALDLHGFLLGARMAYRPLVHAVPASQVEAYPLKDFQVGFFGGIALGGHD